MYLYLYYISTTKYWYIFIYNVDFDTFALIVSIPCGLRKYAFYCPTRKIHKDRRSHFNVPAGLFLPALLSYWVEHIRHSTLLRGEPVVLRKRSQIPAVLPQLRTRSYEFFQSLKYHH